MIPDWIQHLTDEQARQTALDMAPVLDAATQRVHYAEGRRGQYVAVAAGLFAGAVALAALADQAIFAVLEWAIVVASCGFFALSIFLFYVYSKQVNRYPWTSATNTWKWFYRDAIPEQTKFDLGFCEWLFGWNKGVARAKEEFDRQLPIFGESVSRLTDPRESLWQDIQQLYVLHINEKYKNVYLSQLRTVFTSGLVAILLFALVALSAKIVFDAASHAQASLTWCLLLPTAEGNPFSVTPEPAAGAAMLFACVATETYETASLTVCADGR